MRVANRSKGRQQCVTDTCTSAGNERPQEESQSQRQAVSRPFLLVIACFGLAVISLVVRGVPTYDPLAWLIWGREVLDLDLDTTGGPAWKPLPVMITTVFSLFGDVALDLWLVVSRAGALVALAMTYRLTARLAGRPAGVAAALSLLLSADFLNRFIPLGMSEPLLIGLALLAIERHLDGHPTHAYGLAVAAALLRPEVWPFLILYALWMWRTLPGERLVVAGGLVAIPVLWFGPDLWGSGDLFRSSRRIADPTNGGPLLTSRPALAVLDNAWSYLVPPFNLAVLIAVARAIVAFLRRREEIVTLVLTVFAGSWLALVAVMTQLRVAAGERRFLCVAGAIACVLAGKGIADLVEAAAALVRRVTGNHTVQTVQLGVALLAIAVSLPAAFPRVGRIATKLSKVRATTQVQRDLLIAVEKAGGRDAVLSCGQPSIGPFDVPHLAWLLDAHIRDVAFDRSNAGMVFHMPAPPGRVPESSPRLREDGYGLIARAGAWEVWASCGDRLAASATGAGAS